MVGPRELPNAVALNSGLLNASRVIGPAIAGVLIAAVGVGVCFVVNTFSFVAVLARCSRCAQSELYPGRRTRAARPCSPGHAEGLAFAWRDRQVRAVLVVVTCVGLVGFNFNTLVPLLASDTLHVDARAFGLLSAAFGLGAFVGAIATASSRQATFGAFRAGCARLQRPPPRPRPGARGAAGRASSSSGSVPPSRSSRRTPTRSSSSLRPTTCADGSSPCTCSPSSASRRSARSSRARSSRSGARGLAFVVAGLVGLAATAFAHGQRGVPSRPSIEGRRGGRAPPISRVQALRRGGTG